ncbi:uracil-DNA glycosylase [Pseudophaeobacter leonis]|uniref:uracil-DNA glycosylase n=1 Tax=Pseudophaeobacter leonis TaxID=1144477 RepID=UPI0009F1DE4A|nr:uracil-DNA glycosylase [Pseudophaeobacter leonis]
MESALDYWSAKALLEWQVELGATETLCEAPVNRYELAPPAPKAAESSKPGRAPPVPPKPKPVDPVAEARKQAKAAPELPSLRAALAGFRHCDLKMGARNLVFSDGQPGARVMVIGEAPGREEDQQGRPFVGPAGQMLDRMLAAIDLSRDKNVYLTNVLPWRPQQNRDPLPEEVAMMVPFLERHVGLAHPDFLVLMGNVSCQAVLGKTGISRLRGQWAQAWGKPVLPMFHPAYLLRQPGHKRAAWADLLELKARLGAVS